MAEVVASFGPATLTSAGGVISEFAKNGMDYSSFYRRASSYTCKVGPDEGTGWILLVRSELAKLNSSTPYDLILGDSSKTDSFVTIKNLAIIQAQRILCSDSLNPESLYLVQLADPRWFLKRTAINKRYNICETCASNGYCEGTTKDGAGTPWTFSEIVEDIFEEFSGFGGFLTNYTYRSDMISGTLPDTPENIRFEGVSAWDALANLCQLCGFFVRYDPLLGYIDIIQIGIAADPRPGDDGDFSSGMSGAMASGSAPSDDFQTRFPLTRKATERTSDDGLRFDSETIIGSPFVPATVTVVFRSSDTSCSDFCDINTNHGWYYNVVVRASQAYAEVTSGSPGLVDSMTFINTGVTGTTVILNSTKTAQFDSSSDVDPSNLTDLEAVALSLASAYYRSIGLQASGGNIFIGVKKVIPGPFISQVTWREWGDGLHTEITRWPSPVGVQRPQKIFTGGGSGTIRVHFTILSYDEYSGAAQCQVEYRPSGMSTVPEEYAGVVTVYDPALCYFNETPAELVGRWGHADYMTDVTEYSTPIWCVSGLCCPP